MQQIMPEPLTADACGQLKGLAAVPDSYTVHTGNDGRVVIRIQQSMPAPSLAEACV